jgi:hypothetical protein
LVSYTAKIQTTMHSGDTKSRPWPNCICAYHLITSLAQTGVNQECSHSSSPALIHQHYSTISQPICPFLPTRIANNCFSLSHFFLYSVVLCNLFTNVLPDVLFFAASIYSNYFSNPRCCHSSFYCWHNHKYLSLEVTVLRRIWSMTSGSAKALLLISSVLTSRRSFLFMFYYKWHKTDTSEQTLILLIPFTSHCQLDLQLVMAPLQGGCSCDVAASDFHRFRSLRSTWLTSDV